MVPLTSLFLCFLEAETSEVAEVEPPKKKKKKDKKAEEPAAEEEEVVVKSEEVSLASASFQLRR